MTRVGDYMLNPPSDDAAEALAEATDAWLDAQAADAVREALTSVGGDPLHAAAYLDLLWSGADEETEPLVRDRARAQLLAGASEREIAAYEATWASDVLTFPSAVMVITEVLSQPEPALGGRAA